MYSLLLLKGLLDLIKINFPSHYRGLCPEMRFVRDGFFGPENADLCFTAALFELSSPQQYLPCHASLTHINSDAC